ncbi:cytidylate kinase [Sporomusaceae bacterium BoRhaA]|uniref:AAA family ATPase n=1 Tax=Pelorhabdus rhamnosifermentans TaxID=2772457 RepID=UPI001C061405|nr:AAA family ATPase [Pelorhabdus rhamnosifermentans]MBU2699833.1 cytidylate kinase [Pelorhabdus rhamnosifermentans]
MKKLMIINGTMGIGKSTVCKILLDKLKPSIYLDGDWCWNMNPFIVSEENKAMVLDNITHLLKNYLLNSSYKYIVFCWVIHQEAIFNQILEPLTDLDFELYKISLVCSEAALRRRLEQDVQNGMRTSDVINRSVQRLPLYDKMDTVKINVSHLTPQETAKKIYNLIK